MGSRLMPVSLALATLAADALGLRQLALLLGFVAVPAAAAAAFVAISDVLESRPARLRAFTCAFSLVLLVAASADRYGAPRGTPTPRFATFAIVAALVAYAVPLVVWVLEPLLVRPRPKRSRPRVRATLEI
jgi:apolipoprotein N-acyltransferase